jgi:coenzyme F420-reducing hydrogenase beta subunit
MIKINRKQDCSGCHACANVCPVNCITMIEDNEGFLYPNVDISKCIDCGLCEKVCPIINPKEKINGVKGYACVNKNEKIRVESSSGGIFSLLAENMINNGGVVFGAVFDDDFNLIHSYADNIEGLAKLRGSKYVQSKIGDTYNKCREFLEKKIKVLFTGTPCQIAGLISYLGKDYDDLICVDIICYGAPSPKIFKMYRTKIEKKNETTTNRISFRNKDYGWKLSLLLEFNNKEEYRRDVNQEAFMMGFIKNLYNRPSCSECKFRNLNRSSDITIADLWGVGNIVPKLDDNKGTSLVLINSYKGENMFSKLQDEMVVEPIDYKQAFKYNGAALQSAPRNPNRENFFKDLEANADGIIGLIVKYIR